ncbi:MAG: PEGA domain-containing protein [Gammaproteobacteria bacterium]|nr:PEGA domain-containing protein [Gammaproteobacteria bacterium]
MAQTGTTDGLQPSRFQPTQQPSRFAIKLPTWWQWLIIAIGLSIAVVAWFLITATAVRFSANAETADYTVSGGIVITSGPSLLMRPGVFRVEVNAEGYEPLIQRVNVLSQTDQEFTFELEQLPGIVTITGSPPGATIEQNGELLGEAPLTLSLPAGNTQLSVHAARYQSGIVEDEVIGRDIEQTIEYELRPDWADVTLPTSPSGAAVFIDDEPTVFRTPGPIELLAGERKLAVKSPGYERWTDILYVEAEEKISLPPVTLKLVGGTLVVQSEPTGANVRINREYVGTTPLEIDLRPHQNHSVEASLFGYHTVTRNVRLNTAQSTDLQLNLPEVLGEVAVTTQPENVEIWVNRELVGMSNTVLSLHATEHELELRKEGYAGFTKSITVQSDYRQELRVRLLTLEEARLEALEQAKETSEGQPMVLLQPSTITLGASRRQPGRRSNEVFRTVQLERLTYIGKHEITNAQFRRFASGHDSGEFESISLDKDDQPVVNVSWREAAQYCNWLSQKEGFEPFYILRPGDPPTFNANSLGYRLPTEAEWAWTARTQGNDKELLHFPWGDNLPPSDYHGNYADRAAQHYIGRIIFNFNDNHSVSAPIGTFERNYHGVYDMGGNVAEWTHNFYEIPTLNSTVTNLGPNEGEYHVIRGASWMHGTITELRLSFRDYAVDGRRDVGFRLARFAE